MRQAGVTQQTARERSLTRLADLQNPDVVILGGGVNGVASLRDLALNGVSAVLVETNDFCAGASGASSRMAHGGLRYLEGREFKLVAESTRERNRLIAHAPHMVRPLEVVVPLETLVSGINGSVARFAGLSDKGGPLSLLALEGALLLYEAMGRSRRQLPRHRVALNRDNSPPGLRKEIRAVVSYYDGQIARPEGLVLEMMTEALDVSESTAALNHVDWSFDGNSFHISEPWSGTRHAISPKVILNATGGWVDRVNVKLGCRTSYVRCVKGAHLVLSNAALHTRLAGRAFYLDDGAGRLLITLPVGENVLVGTTEIDTPEPDDHDVSPPEIDYLLAGINRLFSDITVARSDITAMTSGMRPLRSVDNGSVTMATRDHALEDDRLPVSELPVLSLVGGKWTTFRSFAEATCDRVLALLDRPRRASTAERDYPGAAPCKASEIASAGNLPLARAETLLARYGALGKDVAAFCAARDDRPIAGAETYTKAEIEWLIAARAACRIEDLVVRRTQLSFSPELKRETLQDLGAILVASLGRDAGEIALEMSDLQCDPRIMGSKAERKHAA